jgi:hypothetical protein
MSSWFQKYFIVWDVIFAVLLLYAIDRFKRRATIRRYRLSQKKRTPLSEIEFCKRLSIDEANAVLVATVRQGLSKRGFFDPDRIYPEDSLWEVFDFQLGDFLDEFVMRFFYAEYECLPDEDLSCVGDFVKFLIQIRAEAKLEDSK